jgi:lysyl-tRNA synthetase, class II
MSDEQPPAPPAAPAPPVEGWPPESAQRLEKARALRAMGVDPYPTRYERTHGLADIRAAHDGKTLEQLEAEDNEVRIAGRVMTLRGHGKASFATLSDGAAELQVYIRSDDVGDGYKLLDFVDRGDFLGVAGRVMRTRKGELSVQAREVAFLGKALLPPPEKWHGLSDVEIRYRQRYVDLMMNPDVRRTFLARSAMVSAMRRFLDDRGYVEVETPMMHPVAGGAVARPFVTHHNALDMDLYLRIAPELYLKRLVVGGLEKVYEINRNFRNEGLSSMHNPEFTMLEFYTALFDCVAVMDITEELIAAAATRIAADGVVQYKDRPVSFRRPFKRITMKEAIVEGARRLEMTVGADLLNDVDALRSWALSSLSQRRNAKGAQLTAARYATLNHGKLIAQLFEDLAEHTFWDPTFVIDYPTEVSPLAKTRPGDKTTTERFELYAAGMEIANGFSELNDPLEQRQRFLDQLKERAKGDLEAHQMDEDYVRALGYGLPPTGGCGVGIDRLAMVLTNSPSIRDVILFPHMRPEAKESHGDTETRRDGKP